MAFEINGKTYETDEDGFLVDLNEWTPEVASYLAEKQNLVLTDNHWQVINFLRDYYNDYQLAPAVRVLMKAVGKKFGAEKGTSKYLEDLFPAGPSKQGCMLAGLPKPSGCV